MTEAATHNARNEHWCTARDCTNCDNRMRALLAVAMGYDNRRPGELNIAAWREAAQRARWTFDEAVEAIHAHYAESPAFLMPGHVTQRIKTARPRHPVHLGLPAAQPADEQTRKRIVAIVRDTFALPKDLHDDRPRRGAPQSAEHRAARDRARADLDEWLRRQDNRGETAS